MSQKTRNLSVAEYFLAIQREYLIADFRRKIYFNPHDKSYYTRVMKYKAEKIDEISNRNNLESILTNKEKMSEMRNELFDKNGRPKFEMSEIDLLNYYAVGNDFSYKGNIYVLESICEDGKLKLQNNSGFLCIEKSEVCRII